MSVKRNTGAPYILFADDHDDTRITLVALAQARGWKAEGVKSVREILERVNEVCAGDGPCFDVIVADVNYFNSPMSHETGPRTTGLTMAEQIYNTFGKGLPIIFYTGYDSFLLRKEAAQFEVEVIEKGKLEKLFESILYRVRWREAASEPYCGDERRDEQRPAIGLLRRKGDRRVGIPEVIETALQEARQASAK